MSECHLPRAQVAGGDRQIAADGSCSRLSLSVYCEVCSRWRGRQRETINRRALVPLPNFARPVFEAIALKKPRHSHKRRAPEVDSWLTWTVWTRANWKAQSALPLDTFLNLMIKTTRAFVLRRKLGKLIFSSSLSLASCVVLFFIISN